MTSENDNSRTSNPVLEEDNDNLDSIVNVKGEAVPATPVESSLSSPIINVRSYSSNSGFVPKKSGLLRLFQSKEYFSPWLAVTYLFKYNDSGIHDYLCQRLINSERDGLFSIAEIQFYLPQICHLLIIRPEESAFVENLLLELSVRSDHFAVTLMWYLEGYLCDLKGANGSGIIPIPEISPHIPIVTTAVNNQSSTSSSNSNAHHTANTNLILSEEAKALYVCSRLYARCNALVFNRRAYCPPSNSSTPSIGQASCLLSALDKGKVVERALPTFLGIGGAMGFLAPIPLISNLQRMALIMGRQAINPNSASSTSLSPVTPSGGMLPSPSPITPVSPSALKPNGPMVDLRTDPGVLVNSPGNNVVVLSPNSTSANGRSRSSASLLLMGVRKKSNGSLQMGSRRSSRFMLPTLKVVRKSPSLEDVTTGRAFSYEMYLSNRELQAERAVTSLEAISPRHTSSKPASTGPIFSCRIDESVTSVPPPSGSLMSPSHMVGYYVHNQITFIQMLLDISSRLVSVPKASRQQSLIAELSLLNHNLPADVCLPFCCKRYEWFSSPRRNEPHSHDKIVRIPPNDAVTLNSADRVPILILVEVLEDEHRTAEEIRDSLTTISANPATASTQSHHNSVKNSPKGSLTSTPLSVKTNNAMSKSIFSAVEAAESGRSSPSSIYLSPENENESPVERKSTLNEEIKEEGDDQVLEEESLEDKKRRKSYSNKRYQEHLRQQRMHDVQTPTDETSTANDVNLPSPDSYGAKMRAAAIMLVQLDARAAASGKPAANATSNTGNNLGPVSNSSLNSAMSNGSFLNGQRAAPPNTPVLNHKTVQKSDVKGLEEINQLRARLLAEMKKLEEERISHLATKKKQGSKPKRIDASEVDSMNESTVSAATVSASEYQEGERVSEKEATLAKEDPSAVVLKESWSDKEVRIRASSPFGKFPNWRLYSIIVKTGADLRQEQLACQVIHEVEKIFKEEKVDVWIYCFKIMPISESSGLIETITNTLSIHSIKKDGYVNGYNPPNVPFTLYDHFVRTFGDPSGERFMAAQEAFLKSLAAYSVLTYLLQIRDRHNGNILIDREGHMIHIDFGFMLSNSPGSVNFESAPFKLVQDYVDILGGLQSPQFSQFKRLLGQSLIALRKHQERIVTLIEIMEKRSRFACFQASAGSRVAGASGSNSATISYPSRSGASHPTISNSPAAANYYKNAISISPSGRVISSSSGAGGSGGVGSTSTSHSSMGGSSAGADYPVPDSGIISALKERFCPGVSDLSMPDYIDKLVTASYGNMFTRLYDSFQYYSNKIL